MDLHRAINDHVYAAKELLYRLQSNERETATEVDLLILRGQLVLLEWETANLLKSLNQQPHQQDRSSPLD